VTLDDTYQTYINRVARMTLPDAHVTQLQHIQESPKFDRLPDGGYQAAAFPGYTIVTPPCQDDPLNAEFYREIQACQEQLIEQLAPLVLIPLPPESFHFTLADLIWGDAYDAARQNPDFEKKLRDCLTETFQKASATVSSSSPIRWQLFGLYVMPRAIGIGLVPKDEQSYDRIIQLRRSIYQNADLIGLSIEQQYHLTAHITIGYFGEIPADLNRDRLVEILSDFNHKWIDSSQEMRVHRAELRKFDNMTRYYRNPDWATLEFEEI
jgi:hypothetical protein